MEHGHSKLDSVIYEFCGTDVVMHFADNRSAVIDREDLPKLMPHRWSMKAAGYVTANGCRIKGKETPALKLGRYILGILDPMVYVDHIDRDPTNCRKCNLRAATPQQNALNRVHPTTGQTAIVVRSEDLHGLLGHRTISSGIS